MGGRRPYLYPWGSPHVLILPPPPFSRPPPGPRPPTHPAPPGHISPSPAHHPIPPRLSGPRLRALVPLSQQVRPDLGPPSDSPGCAWALGQKVGDLARMAPGRTEAHGAHPAPPAARTHSRRSAAPPGRTLTFPSPDSVPRVLALLVVLGTRFLFVPKSLRVVFWTRDPPPQAAAFQCFQAAPS